MFQNAPAEQPGKIKYRPLEYPEIITGSEILEKHPTGIKYGHLVQGWKRLPVFIDAKDQIMSMPPIVNSHDVGKITENTENVFVEVTGPDFNTINIALNVFVSALVDMGGQVHEVKMVYGKKSFASPNLSFKKMKLNLKHVSKVLGIKLSEKEAQQLLRRMGYSYSKGIAGVPPYRADIMGEIDIIEDIAIAYGYNSFTPTLPDFFHPGGFNKKNETYDEVMRGMGFVEAKTFILTNREKLAKIGYKGKTVELTNPASEEYSILRPNLVGDFLEVFAGNKMRKLPQKNYEIGFGYIEKGEKYLIFGMMDKKIEFSDFRGYLQTLMGQCNLKFSLVKVKNELMENDFSSGLVIEGEDKGIFGKISKKVLEKFGIGFDVYLCQIKIG